MLMIYNRRNNILQSLKLMMEYDIVQVDIVLTIVHSLQYHSLGVEMLITFPDELQFYLHEIPNVLELSLQSIGNNQDKELFGFL